MLWIQAEEGLENVLIPRFIAAGGNRSRIFTLQEAEPWTAANVDDLRATVESLEIGLVVIDPIKAYQCGVDDNSETSVRATLQGLNQLSVPVVAVRHWKKGGGIASERGAGSIAYLNVSRASVVVAPEPGSPKDCPRRFVAPEKCSMTMPPTTWEVSIDKGPTVANTVRPVVKWLWKRPDIEANDLSRHVDPKDRSSGGGKRGAARDVMVDRLRGHGGEAGRAVVLQAALDEGIGDRTAKAALSDLRDDGTITVEKEFGGCGIVRMQEALV